MFKCIIRFCSIISVLYVFVYEYRYRYTNQVYWSNRTQLENEKNREWYEEKSRIARKRARKAHHKTEKLLVSVLFYHICSKRDCRDDIKKQCVCSSFRFSVPFEQLVGFSILFLLFVFLANSIYLLNPIHRLFSIYIKNTLYPFAHRIRVSPPPKNSIPLFGGPDST